MGESVSEAVAQTGHPLLRKAAEDNAKTWKFASHTPSIFNVTFRYKLMESGVEVEFLRADAILSWLRARKEDRATVSPGYFSLSVSLPEVSPACSSVRPKSSQRTVRSNFQVSVLPRFSKRSGRP